jgi:uncharacterized Tic20 family protein
MEDSNKEEQPPIAEPPLPNVPPQVPPQVPLMEPPLSNTGERVPTKDERTWAMIAHLSAFAYYVSGVGHIVGPLIVWLAKRDGNPFIEDQAKEALNFQITITIIGLVALIMVFTVILAIIGIPVLIGLHLFQIICMIIAAIKANEGVAFRYPLTLRLIK